MALSELDMMNLWAKQLTGYKSQWERLFGFGYAAEPESAATSERPSLILTIHSPATERGFHFWSMLHFGNAQKTHKSS